LYQRPTKKSEAVLPYERVYLSLEMAPGYAPGRCRRIFGANVRAARKLKGWSQERLGDEADLHRTFIGPVERGEQNVSIDNMERMAAALEVDLADLLVSGQDGQRDDPGGEVEAAPLPSSALIE
jgi:DNA-binding XRE family transcriptional regulator